MRYPKHLAIIPDGCRRWAIKNKLPPWKGHQRGIEVLEKIGKWSLKTLPIKYYTIYGLSFENLNRPKPQLNALAKLYSEHFLQLAEEKVIHENKVNINILGRFDLLPKKIQDAANVAINATKSYNKKFFRIALAYSGRKEIVDSVKKLLKENKEITEENITNNLYSDAPEPDLILRTAEKRMSNFLLWEGAYSEVHFSKKLWPDITRQDYIKILEDFDKRKRRFGK